MTGDLFARPNREDEEISYCYLTWAEALSMWAFVEPKQHSFPILTKLWRSVYGPEFEIDHAALLAELGNLERNLDTLAQHTVAAQAQFEKFIRGFRKSDPRARVDNASMATAISGIGRMKGFLTAAKAQDRRVYNSTD